MIHPLVGAGLAFAAWQGYVLVKAKFSGDGREAVSERIEASPEGAARPALNLFATEGVERYPMNIADVPSDDISAGPPEFFNMADFSRGRFLGWEPPRASDLADDAKRRLRRMRIGMDTTKFWWFKTSVEKVTPCVFDPALDVEFISPGTYPGVPLEGIVLIKRSLDGKRLAREAISRALMETRDLQHLTEIQADVLYKHLSLERLKGVAVGSDRHTEEMEKIAENHHRIMRKIGGTQRPPGFGEGMPFANPFGEETFGADSAMQGGGGMEGAWRLES